MKPIGITKNFIYGLKKTLIPILLFLLSVEAYSAPTITLNDSITSIDITSQVEMFEDTGGNRRVSDFLETPDKYLFISNQADDLLQNHGSTYWVRFTLANSSILQKWYLTDDRYSSEEIQLFQLFTTDLQTGVANSNNGKYQTIQIPPSQRLTPTFSIFLPKQQETSYYLRIKYNSFISKPHLRLYSPDALLQQSNQDNIFYALIIGAMLIIGIYNFILSFILKDPIYAVLSIAIIGQTLMASNNNGLYQQITGISLINSYIYNALYLITIVSAFDFLRRIIEAKYFVPLINKLSLGIEFIALGMLAIIYWIPNATVILDTINPIFFIIALVGAIQAQRNGKRFATSLIIIVPVYTITTLPINLATIGLLEDITIYQEAIHIGFLLTIVLLSLTLAEKTREIKESSEVAQAANNAKSLFLANMSHELRTPMNAVIGFGQLLKQTPLDSKQLSYIDNSQNSAKHMVELIDKVFDFSKLDAGKLKLESTTFRVKDLIQFVATHIEASCKAKNLKLIVHIGADTPEKIHTDELCLRQVLINLANNAVKFTEKGQITLSVSMVKSVMDRILLRFSVVDTGIGIEAKYCKNLFKQFTQANTDYSRKYGGMGLGLAISKEILELMGTEIKLKSSLGKGSRFSFEVWVEEEKEPTKERLGVLENLDKRPRKFLPELVGKHVLVVEDDYYNQMVVQKLLESQGVNVTLAGSGQAAIKILKQSKFDLIFMDIQMPDQDGYETTQKIRFDPHLEYTPIIALTAHAGMEAEEKCLAAGMDGVLTKPIDLDLLTQTLINFLPPSDKPKLHSKIVGTKIHEQSDRQIQAKLQDATDMLSKKSTKIFLQTTLQYLEDSKKELLELLGNGFDDHSDSNNWNKASTCAHRLRGSINLYGSDQLDLLLKKIDKKEFRKSELGLIRKELDFEYSAIIVQMESILDQS